MDDRGPDDCWPWLGGRLRDGYGSFAGHEVSETTAHRVAWALANGPIPKGLWVLHSCDNPPCCNPAHLFLGTHLDNMADRDRKGRGIPPPRAKGDAAPNRRLTEAAVRDIRRARDAGVTLDALGRRYGVSRATVDLAARGINWAHVV